MKVLATFVNNPRNKRPDGLISAVADGQYPQWVSVKRSNVCSLKCILICCDAVNNDVFVGFG